MLRPKKRKRLKSLTRELKIAVWRVANEHYHTKNPPPWDGWIVREADMFTIRQIIGEMDRIENPKPEE